MELSMLFSPLFLGGYAIAIVLFVCFIISGFVETTFFLNREGVTLADLQKSIIDTIFFKMYKKKLLLLLLLACLLFAVFAFFPLIKEDFSLSLLLERLLLFLLFIILSFLFFALMMTIDIRAGLKKSLYFSELMKKKVVIVDLGEKKGYGIIGVRAELLSDHVLDITDNIILQFDVFSDDGEELKEGDDVYVVGLCFCGIELIKVDESGHVHYRVLSFPEIGIMKSYVNSNRIDRLSDDDFDGVVLHDNQEDEDVFPMDEGLSHEGVKDFIEIIVSKKGTNGMKTPEWIARATKKE